MKIFKGQDDINFPYEITVYGKYRCDPFGNIMYPISKPEYAIDDNGNYILDLNNELIVTNPSDIYRPYNDNGFREGSDIAARFMENALGLGWIRPTLALIDPRIDPDSPYLKLINTMMALLKLKDLH